MGILARTHLVHIKAELVASCWVDGDIKGLTVLWPAPDRLTGAGGLGEDRGPQWVAVQVHSRRVISPHLKMEEGIARSDGLKYLKDYISGSVTAVRLENGLVLSGKIIRDPYCRGRANRLPGWIGRDLNREVAAACGYARAVRRSQFVDARPEPGLRV